MYAGSAGHKSVLVLIKGESIHLREVDSEDAEVILRWENNPEFWEITEDHGPFTLEEIKDFIHRCKSLISDGQQRFMILDSDFEAIGMVDLFAYDKMLRSAGVGILIADKQNRRLGYGKDALKTLIEFLQKKSLLNKLNCTIYPENTASIKLFLSCGFIPDGQGSFKGRKVNYYTHKL